MIDPVLPQYVRSERHSAGSQRDQLAAAMAEYLELQDQGITPDRDEFLRRHADLAPALGECLRNLEWIDRLATDRAMNSVAADGSMGNTKHDRFIPDGVMGEYRVIRQVGRGGMGIVYEAEQSSLHRRVALKVLPTAALLDPRALTRFRNEAHAAATLDHPHIVNVIGVGCEHGVHYYAMRFIDGISLADLIARLRQDAGLDGEIERMSAHATHLRAVESTARCLSRTLAETDAWPEDSRPLAANGMRRAAELGLQAAEALEHAHQQGIVHRDIKPSNLLLDRRAKLWVTDFGLARLETDASLTMTGELIGTLRYMSPEQTLGQPLLVDHRTDVYSLGATLYELLTLRPLFNGDDRHGLLQQIAQVNPPPPRRWVPDIPTSLERIILKAIAKDPRDRYATAAELATDLRRFLDQQPVVARPLPWTRRLLRWSQRRPRQARYTAALGGLLLAGLCVSVVGMNHTVHQTRLARTEELAAKQIAAVTQANLDAHQHVTRVNLAAFAYQQQHALDVCDVSDPAQESVETRFGQSFEWRLLQKQSQARPICLGQHEGEAYSVRLSPDETQLASAGTDGVRIWDRKSGRQTQHLALHEGDVNGVAWSPDGTYLASAGDDGQIRVYTTRDWQVAETLTTEGPVVQVDFTPAGDRFVAAERSTYDGNVRRGRNVVHVWQTSDWQPQHVLAGPSETLQGLAVSHDGQYVAAASYDRHAYVWHLDSGQLHLRLSSARAPELPGPPVLAVAFAHHRPLLAFHGGDGYLLVFDVTTGDRAFELTGADGAEGVIFSPDDRFVVSASRAHTVRVWQLAEQKTIPPRTVFCDEESLWSVCAAKDGTIFTASRIGKIHQRNLHLATDRRRLSLDSRDVQNWLAEHSPHAERSGPREYELRTLRDVTDRKQSMSSLSARLVRFSPDGRELLVAGPENELTFWDIGSGHPVEHVAVGDRSGFGALTWSSDGRSIALSRVNAPQVVLVQRHPLREAGSFRSSEVPCSLAFSVDTKTLYLQAFNSSSFEHVIDAFDVNTGRRNLDGVPDEMRNPHSATSLTGDALAWLIHALFEMEQPSVGDLYLRRELGASADVSLDRQTLVNAYHSGTLQIRTSPHWTNALQAAAADAVSIRVAPHGDTIVGWTASGGVVFWNTSTGRELMRIDSGLSAIWDVAFAPDGTRLVAAGINHQGVAELVVWDAL